MNTNYRQLRRSSANRMIAGVCAGVGEYSNVDPTVIRLIAVLLLFVAGPATLVAYLILALIIPEATGSQVT
jgi:phage shock protein PspC (stress-responsive transcriptional regulator)